MKRIGIFCFSGTGNTEIVANLLAEGLRRRQADVEIIRVEDVLYKGREVQPDNFDLIGVGHPVLGFDATGVVYNFVRLLPHCAGKKAFVFKTAGDPHYVNYGASKSIIKIMRAKGYEVFHDSLTAMPCNWYLRYDDRLVKQLYEAAVKKADKISWEILTETARTLKINPVLRAVLKLIYHAEEKLGAKYFGKGLKASGACISCKKCVNECPSGNITMEGTNVRFGSKCIWCMRCIYSCPKNAICPSIFISCVLKDGYNGGFNIQRILDDPAVEGNFVTDKTRGYYKHFYKYLSNI